MDAAMTLVVVCAVLGGLVCLLALIYAYIYCFKMNPRHRHKGADAARTQFYTREGQSAGAHHDNSQSGDGGRKKVPFLLWGYAAKLRKESVDQP